MLIDLVEREFEALKGSIPDFCTCSMCRDDVMVYALNRLPPRYVAQATGEVISNVVMGADQPKTDVSVLLLEGMRKVKARPREGHENQVEVSERN
ncbi:MAG: late competence development ComFB family protein [Gemmatimonadales bacterium]